MAIADLNLVVQVLAAAKRLPMAVSFRMKSISRPKLQVLDLERCQENGGYILERKLMERVQSLWLNHAWCCSTGAVGVSPLSTMAFIRSILYQ